MVLIPGVTLLWYSCTARDHVVRRCVALS